MKNWSKRVLCGALVMSMGSLAMHSEPIESEKKAVIQKSKAFHCSERSKLYQLVTADWLDTDQLLSNKKLFWSVNERDRHGCTPLYHLMMHEDATVQLINHFIKHGAQFVVNHEARDALYAYLFRTVINHDHCIALGQKLLELEKMLESSDNQCSLKKRSKSSAFYIIR